MFVGVYVCTVCIHVLCAYMFPSLYQCTLQYCREGYIESHFVFIYILVVCVCVFLCVIALPFILSS